MNLNPVVLAIPLYFALIFVELIYQIYKKDVHYRLNDALTNISCGVTQQISGVFFKVISIGVYTLIYENFRFIDVKMTWYIFIIYFILTDFFYYWAHRKSHDISLFWGGHVVHHQSEDYNLSVALRQSTFQVFFTFTFFLPLAFFGFDPVYFVIAYGVNLVYQFWIHTESIDKMGWFELIFNTPSHHRVHHGKNPKYIDKNHAGVFIIWDKMFGTFQEEEERPVYGITTPLNSWDPIWANLDHFKNLGKAILKVKNISDAFKILFNKPGWMPEYLGGHLKPKEIDRSKYKKFDIGLNNLINGYVLSQYAIVLGFTNVFLFFHSKFTLEWIPSLDRYLPTPKWYLALLIFFSLWSIAKLMEKKVWAFWTEIIRWGFIIIIYYFMIVNIAGDLYNNASYSLYFDLGIFLFIGLAIISCSSLFYIKLKNS